MYIDRQIDRQINSYNDILKKINREVDRLKKIWIDKQRDRKIGILVE